MRHGLTIVLVSVLAAVSAFAIDTGDAFDDPALQARYEGMIAEVRCVVCQNQSIKDSNAVLAIDLRREIRRLISEGKTDGEVADFLVTRYGDFILYRPQFSGKTLYLWVAPFLLILLGGIAIVRVVRHRMTLPIEDESSDEGQA